MGIATDTNTVNDIVRLSETRRRRVGVGFEAKNRTKIGETAMLAAVESSIANFVSLLMIVLVSPLNAN